MTVAELSGAGTASRALAERLAGRVFQACAVVATATALAVVGVLGFETVLFFTEVSPARFFTEATWTPFSEEPRFGVLPLLAATAQITVGAAVFAVLPGVMTALYLHQYADARSATVVGTATSLLAGVPTVVYGYIALNFVTPALRAAWPEVEAFNGLSACLVVGLMILPTVVVLSREALESVPASLMEAGLALGATRDRVVVRVLIPAASRGIIGSVVLAMARAAGETMIVTLAAGNQARLTWNPLEGIRTLTAFIGQSSLGDAPSGTLHYRAFFAVGAVLFVVTYVMYAGGRRLLSRRDRDGAR
ncbi:MAG: phosphate ABC transporter permease subunit PstC [Gemmatimonadetes bacterium]|nr:phosphate ABC transporter permease subunit PstC [Gemmatimonadota bacterium]